MTPPNATHQFSGAALEQDAGAGFGVLGTILIGLVVLVLLITGA